ncbi:MAG: hypothetical protein IKW86_03215 [Salinivirgaceae bacterium]|nr:hypothetical protein [Salinivirgaceae bacterium]
MESHLSYRANVMTFDYNKKTIVIYDDHRWILNVLKCLSEDNFFEGKTPNIIYFDKHDDAAPLFPNTKDTIKQYNNKDKKGIRDFWTIVEFDLNPNDDDWVTAGMEFDLINNAVCIGNECNDNILKWENHIYKAQDDIEHKGYCINHLEDELGSQGIIGDSTIKHSYYKDVRGILGYISATGSLSPETPYVLDFDLDCFTTECRDYPYAWPERIFWEEYVNPCKNAYFFVQKLISNASIITICREPECCGGIGESNKILGYLDRYFFDGALRTEPIR